MNFECQLIKTLFLNQTLQSIALQADKSDNNNGMLDTFKEMSIFENLAEENKAKLEKQGVTVTTTKAENIRTNNTLEQPTGTVYKRYVTQFHITQKIGDKTVEMDCNQSGLMGNITAKDKDGNKLSIREIAKIFNIGRKNIIQRIFYPKAQKEYINEDTGAMFIDKNNDGSLDGASF